MRLVPLLLLAACVPMEHSFLEVRPGALYDVDVTVEPDPPVAGDLTLRMFVSDEGEPVPGCAVGVMAMMPEHGHGGMNDPVVTEEGDGDYAIAWKCPMAGHWEITADLDCPSGTDQVVIDLHVD